MSYYSQIVGTGSGFPEKVMTNFDFEKIVDTSDEWIRTRTGIETRRIADTTKGECTSSFIEEAGRKALKMAGMTPLELDAIIIGTVTADTFMPCAANTVQAKLGAKNAFSFDLQAACSGFLYSLSIADSFIRTGQIRTALVAGGETLSTYVNWKDRGTCVLFGDGAGAVVLKRTESKDHAVIATKLFSDGSQGDFLSVPHGFAKVPVDSPLYNKDFHKIRMQGADIFKLAVRNMVDCSIQTLEENHLKISDVDFFIFHQANIRIIDMCLKTLGVDRAKTWINVQKYGNISAGTLPVCLDEAWAAGAVKPGQLVLMSTFGGGTTWGCSLVRL